MLKQLQKLGFSGLEAEIYTLLLKGGAASTSELARVTGKHRPAIYGALPRLLESGLISIAKKGKRQVYEAESPIVLLALVKKQESQLQSSLPGYLNAFLNRSRKPRVTFFEGKSGIQAVYEHLIASANKGEIIYRYESPKDYKKNKAYYPPVYWEHANWSGDIEKYVITNATTHLERHDNLNRYSKSVPAAYDKFDYNITQLICKDKVAFIDYETEMAILIENQRFADFQRKLFKLFFGKL